MKIFPLEVLYEFVRFGETGRRLYVESRRPKVVVVLDGSVRVSLEMSHAPVEPNRAASKKGGLRHSQSMDLGASIHGLGHSIVVDRAEAAGRLCIKTRSMPIVLLENGR